MAGQHPATGERDRTGGRVVGGAAGAADRFAGGIDPPGADEPAVRRKPRRSLVSRWSGSREPEVSTPLFEGSGPRSEGDAGEREILVNALREAGGNKSRAARLLGMPRSTLFSKLAKHGLEDAPPRKG